MEPLDPNKLQTRKHFSKMHTHSVATSLLQVSLRMTTFVAKQYIRGNTFTIRGTLSGVAP